MLKKLIPLFAFALILIASTPLYAQTDSKDSNNENTASAKPDKAKAKGEARWEGTVIRSSKDKSTLTVRSAGPNGHEKTVHYDESTKWVSQAHGSKDVNNIDASQVSDGDRVIVKGTQEKNGEFHATLISKRLTPLPGSSR